MAGPPSQSPPKTPPSKIPVAAKNVHRNTPPEDDRLSKVRVSERSREERRAEFEDEADFQLHEEMQQALVTSTESATAGQDTYTPSHQSTGTQQGQYLQIILHGGQQRVVPVSAVSTVPGAETWNRFNVVNGEDMLINGATPNVAFLDYQNELHGFSSSEEIFTYRDTLTDETDLWAFDQMMLEHSIEVLKKTVSWFGPYILKIRRDKTWRADKNIISDPFDTDYAEVYNTVINVATINNELAAAVDTVCTTLPRYGRWVATQATATNVAKGLRKLMNKIVTARPQERESEIVREMVICLNFSLYERFKMVRSKKQGIRHQKDWTQTDINRAIAECDARLADPSRPLPQFDPKILDDVGLRMGNLDILTDAKDLLKTQRIIDNVSAVLPPAPLAIAPVAEVQSSPTQAGAQGSTQLSLVSRSVGSQQRQSSATGQQLPQTELRQTRSQTLATSRRQPSVETYVSINNDTQEETTTTIRKTQSCTCTHGLGKGYLNNVPRTASGRPFNLRKTDIGRLTRMLEQYASRAEHKDTVCFKHTRLLASYTGLQQGGGPITSEMVSHRLFLIAQNWDRIGDISVHVLVPPETTEDTPNYLWFKQKGRAPIPSVDNLGVMAYQPAPLGSTVEEILDGQDLQAILAVLDDTGDYDWSALLERIGLPPTTFQDFQTNGTINLDLFSWLWDHELPVGQTKTIGELLYEEAECYEHHTRKTYRTDHLGWLRGAVYTIGQQIMRTSVEYFLVYMALRPDHCYRLISYPYYEKLARFSAYSKTAFRHIDIDINRLADDNRGGNMIQGSLSLTNETANVATIVLPKMHHHIDEWVQRMQARGAPVKGLIQAIEEVHFTTVGSDSDKTHFATDWTPVPCKRGEVRVTMPHLPHGAQSTNAGDPDRFTMLPWFIAVQKDGDSLEIPNAGTWSMLSESHRDQTAPLATPSGYANMYGKIPFAFPAGPQLLTDSAISAALVGRMRHSNPAFIYELRLVLLATATDLRHNIQQRHASIIHSAYIAFDQLVRAEKEFYRGASYFTMRENGGQPLPDEDRAGPAEDQGALPEEEGQEAWNKEMDVLTDDES